MARYIDADDLKSVINANDWSNPVVPQVVCTIIDRSPTADVAPRAEIAREIFEQILNALKYTRFASPLEKTGTLEYIYALKNKYTEEGK